jgi:hypothetical protein
MTGVILSQSMVLVLMFIVHGHVRPIDRSGCRGEGPRDSPPCQRAPRVPRVRLKYAKGVGRSHAYVAGVGRGRNHSWQGAGVGRFDDVMGLGRGGRRP